MRLLFVSMADSLHAARALGMLAETGWEIHLFDANLGTTLHPALRNVTVHPANPCVPASGSGVEIAPAQRGPTDSFDARVRHLNDVLEDVQPDLVQSDGLIDGSALVDAVWRSRGPIAAPWLATNWGSDLLVARDSPVYRPGVRSVLSHCGYYRCVCHRDVALARAFGFRGRVIGIWPTPGGFDLDSLDPDVLARPPSTRRAVVLKGAVTANTRGHVGFEAIERCADLLTGWEIAIYDAHPDVEEHAKRFARDAGTTYSHLSSQDGARLPHAQMLAAVGRARVSISLNRFDGTSNALIEAMSLGAFCVGPAGGCGMEIAIPGTSALFVPADDGDAVTSALRRALTDDELVDRAAVVNRSLVARHLDLHRLQDQVIDSYERIVADHRARAA
jgi:hypothetical protein